MTIKDLLDELRSAVPDCRLAAYVDLGSALVLSASASAMPQQETLDGLADTAARLLPLDSGGSARPGAPDQAVLTSAGDLLVLARSAGEPCDVICCKCADTADIDTVLSGARAALNWIGAPPG